MKVIPSYDIALKINDAETVNTVIELLKNMDVPIHEDSQGYDELYPYLFWSGDSHYISQTSDPNNKDVSETEVFEFLKHFIEYGKPKFKMFDISDDYKAKVSAENVKVGCQTVSFELLEEIYTTMLEFRK